MEVLWFGFMFWVRGFGPWIGSKSMKIDDGGGFAHRWVFFSYF